MKFTPCELPPTRRGGWNREDYALVPCCEACDVQTAVDVTSKLCRECHRLLTVIRIAIAESKAE